MRLITNTINVVKKVPFVFWVGVILYGVTFFSMVHWKREPPNKIIFVVTWCLFFILFLYEIFFSLSRKRKTIEFIKNHFIPEFKDKSVIRKSYAWSNFSLFLGAISFLLFLSNVHWAICYLFFASQLFFSVSSLIAYILKYRNDILNNKFKYGVLFSSVISIVSVIANILSRKFITAMFEVYPEKLPTVTIVIYWYLFLLIFTYVAHMVFLFFSDGMKKRFRVINNYLISIFLSVSISSVTIAGVLYVNYAIILNWLVSVSYLSDALPVYRCNGAIADKSKYGDKSAFINITDDLYRVIYFKNGVIESEDVKCTGDSI